MFVDSHAHLTSDAVFPDISELLQRATAASISKIINICTDIVTLERGIALHDQHSWVYNAAATTPHDVDRFGDAHFEIIAQAARSGQLVAIGETGLDYHYKHSAPDSQKHFLKRYLHLAMECSLPVIIHCRDAFSDLFDILDQEYQGSAILHCFTGNQEEAKEVIKRGMYLSLSGIVTFKNSEELRAVAKWTPINQLLIETDTPYLAPQPHRGKRNEPAFLVETAKAIASQRGISIEELAEATETNATTVFNL